MKQILVMTYLFDDIETESVGIEKSAVHKTFQEARLLVNDPAVFDRFIANNVQSFGSIEQVLLCKWLRFFLDNHSYCVCLYSATVFALIDMFSEGNRLFFKQTEYERGISFSFYQKLFESKIFLETNNKETAKYLLTIALIYGKYPGMQIRPFRHAVNIVAKHGLNEQSLHEMFAYLFVKYENPKVLTYNLVNLDVHEIDVLMFTLQGNNIGRYPNISVPISKNTSFFLVNKVPGLKFQDNVLKCATAAAQLISVCQDEELFYEFIHSCRTFNHRNIDVFIDDIDFWKNACRILAQAQDKTALTVQEFVDYFEYQKYHSEKKSYSLKGKTVHSIAMDILEWHGNVGRDVNDEELLNRSWHKLENTEQIYQVSYGEDQYTFSEIISGVGLAIESDVMKHCVFSYLPDCLSGYSSIWSMKKSSGIVLWNIKGQAKHYFERHMTIEVVDREIVQIAGKNNARPSRGDLRAIKKWAEMALLSIETWSYEI